TKSRKQRTVALTPRALSALDDIPPVLGTNLIFANPDTGRLYGVTTFQSWFRVACIASKIDRYAAEGERVVIHSLRHSGASAADKRGASLRAIQDALGHSSIATTAKYVHRDREESALEMAKLMADGAETERNEDADAKRRPPHRSTTHDVGLATPKLRGSND
ncbi:MAG TPA: tyrosine-type recombinase/integrase, partial [Polyangia bacterium]|nr:tyrosine-type recombinase/integrase [Polyangia bacterium]